jgi:hypothetical protein
MARRLGRHGSADVSVNETAQTSIGSQSSAPLPRINVRDLDLRRVTPDAVAALQRANEPPSLFRYGGSPMRLERDEHGAPILRPVTDDRLRHHLARAADRIGSTRRAGRKGRAPADARCPRRLGVADRAAAILTRVVEAPHRSHRPPDRTGLLCPTRASSRPAGGFLVPTVPPDPSATAVAEAQLLIDDLLVTSRLGGRRAGTLPVLLLQSFVRELIDGPRRSTC